MRSARKRRRASFARLLKGNGLEIGALLDPLPIPHASRIAYSDLLSAEQLEQMYPGSRMPDIISNSETFPTVQDHEFDFVVANHVLEHLTDPIGALIEWHRILKPNGLLMLALPDKRFTFDAARERTSLGHLIADHQSTDPPEIRNRVHLEEWATHVERLSPGSSARARWIEEQLRSGYAVHNHVWIAADILKLIEWMNEATAASWRLERLANTSPLTNEFILLLRRVHQEREPAPFAAVRPRLLLADPLLGVLARVKRLLRGSDRRHFGPGTR